jgi:hypothetical protein
MQKTSKKHQKMGFFMFFSSKEIQAGPAQVPHGYCGYLDPGSGLYLCSTHTLYLQGYPILVTCIRQY